MEKSIDALCNIVHNKVGTNLDASPNVYLSTVGDNDPDNPYQLWKVVKKSDGTFRIIHNKTGRALDAQENRQVYLSSPDSNSESNPYQRWKIVRKSKNDIYNYRIIHHITNLALD